MNQKQIYVTKFNNEIIQNINESVDYLLDEFIPFKSYKYKVTVNCFHKKRKLDGDLKTTIMNFRTEEDMTKDFRLDLNQWLTETNEGYGYD